MYVQKGGVCEGWSREPSRSVFNPNPVLLNLDHTWNDLVSFKNTDSCSQPQGFWLYFMPREQRTENEDPATSEGGQS